MYKQDNSHTTLGETMGLSVIEETADTVIMTAPVAGNTQPHGILHGGANGVLVEEAGSRLAFMRAPQGRVPVGTELNCSNLQAVAAGTVTATATVIHQGTSSIVTRVDIRDDNGRLTASGRLTCVYISTRTANR